MELGFLEVILPIFRIAHAALDTDQRQVGEANVFPSGLRLDVPTEWRTCNLPGTRYQNEKPMNVTAMRVMRAHWSQMMATLLRVREAYLSRFPEAAQELDQFLKIAPNDPFAPKAREVLHKVKVQMSRDASDGVHP